jgi:hypothetical protein
MQASRLLRVRTLWMGFVLWVVLGIAVTTLYDRKGLDRMESEVLDYVNRSVVAAYTEGTRQPLPAG